MGAKCGKPKKNQQPEEQDKADDIEPQQFPGVQVTPASPTDVHVGGVESVVASPGNLLETSPREDSDYEQSEVQQKNDMEAVEEKFPQEFFRVLSEMRFLVKIMFFRQFFSSLEFPKIISF